MWLTQETFFRAVAQSGLQPAPVPATLNQLPPGSVLVWEDAAGTAQHACLYVGEGLVFNKDSQCWYTPRQIRPLQSLLDDWQEPGLTMRLFSPA